MQGSLRGYTFSSDTGLYPFHDMMDADLMAEKFFHTANDPKQLRISVKNDKRIYEKFPECENIIKYKNKIIGETFVLPCTQDIMHAFLDGNITEAQLFEQIMDEVDYQNFDAVYLCLANVDPQHQGKGLATKGRIKTLVPLIKRNPNLVLFGRGFSKEGTVLLQHIATLLDRPLLLKK